MMPTLNAPLMFKTLDYIRENPEQWNQGEWGARNSCGTVACFAGTATLLAGYTFDFCYADVNATDVLTNGMSIRETARVELGLSQPEANVLFYGGNTLEDLEELVATLTSGLPTFAIAT